MRPLIPTMSVEGIEFLNAMLTYDPDDRINAKDCLNHLFFRDMVKEDSSKEPKVIPLESQTLKITELNENSVIKTTEAQSQQIDSLKIKSSLKVVKIPDTETQIKIEKNPEPDIKTTILPQIEDKNSKMTLSTIGISTKATIFGNEFKNIKYSIHPDGVIDVSATSHHVKKNSNNNNVSTTLPKIPQSNSVVSSLKGNRRPSYEAPPLSNMSSNYHIIKKTDPEKSTFIKPRYSDDNRPPDVALTRARRAVKRQNEINSGKIKGRLSQKGQLGLNLNVVGNQKLNFR